MSPLVIGLVAGLVVAAVVIFCCIRSVCKEKTVSPKQKKRVAGCWFALLALSFACLPAHRLLEMQSTTGG